jgi:hypothetical protein
MSKIHSIPQENIQSHIDSIVREVLDGDYKKVSISQLDISEDLKNDSTLISCDMFFGEKNYSLEGTGRGLVDALFGALLGSLKKDYISLENITLQDFVVTVDMNKFYRKKSKTDASVEAAVFVVNKMGKTFLFRHTCKSMISASVLCVAKMIEYYVNSELAVVHLKACIKDSQERARPDLTERYVSLLSELVRNVSYEKTITNLERSKVNEKGAE